MNEKKQQAGITVEQAMRAQKALRDAAGLKPEQFPMEAFVGMISDEIEALRKQGHSDEQIAHLVSEKADIHITGGEIAEHYAPADQRHPPHE